MPVPRWPVLKCSSMAGFAVFIEGSVGEPGGARPLHLALVALLHCSRSRTGSALRRIRSCQPTRKRRLRASAEVPREIGGMAQAGSGNVARLSGAHRPERNRVGCRSITCSDSGSVIGLELGATAEPAAGHYGVRKLSMLADVQVATPQPKKSVSSVQIGQPSAKAAARIGQSSGSRDASRFRASVSNSA